MDVNGLTAVALVVINLPTIWPDSVFPCVRLENLFYFFFSSFACHYVEPANGRGWTASRRRPSPTGGLHKPFIWVEEIFSKDSHISLFMSSVLWLSPLCWKKKMPVASRVGESCWQSLDFRLAESTKWGKSSMMAGLWGKHESRNCVCVFVCDTASISRNVLLLQTKKHHKAYTTLSFLSQCHQTFFRRNRWTRFVCFLARKRLISLCGCVRKSNLTLFGENESMADKSTRTEEYEGQGWEKKKMRRKFFSSICKEVEMSTKEVEIQFCSTGSDKLVCFFFLNRKFSAQSLKSHNTDNNTVFMRKKRNNFFVTEADPEVVSPIHLQKTFCWGSCLMSSQKIDFNLEMWSLFPTFRLWITVFTNGPPHLRTI